MWSLGALTILALILAGFGRALPAVLLFGLCLAVLILPNGAALIVAAFGLGLVYLFCRVIVFVVANAGDHIEVYQMGDHSAHVVTMERRQR